MKEKLIAILLMVVCYKSPFAQPFDNEHVNPVFVHLITGFSNYSGDLKLEQYSFNQSKTLYGLGFQKYVDNNLSVRAEMIYTKLSGDDKLSGEKYRLKRNLNFMSSITEASLLLQYDLFSVHDEDRRVTPYIIAGGGYFHYSPYTTDASGNEVSIVAQNKEGTTFKLNQFNLAIGAGLKWNMSNHLKVAAELNSKGLFTDYLDGVSIRGNAKNKDNYYYMAVHFSINLAAFASNSISYYRN